MGVRYLSSLLKNPLEEVIRERKGSLPRVVDAQL
jgi:hypothetical protein